MIPYYSVPRFRPLIASVASLLALPAATGLAGAFSWNNQTGNWSVGSNWAGSASPTGSDVTDVLTFGGNVGTTGVPTTYVSTQNIAVTPFLLNQIDLNGTDNSASGLTNTIAGTELRLTGTTPAILQSGAAGFAVNLPIDLGAPVAFGGNGTGVVTLNGALSGSNNITKNGTSTFRFGTAGNGIPSTNTWFGSLTINAGTVRFNNNSASGPTALRANPVSLNAATATVLVQTNNSDDAGAGLRLGTLSGTGGVVQARREQSGSDPVNFNSAPILITAIENGSYAGVVRNNKQGSLGTLDQSARLVVRGVGVQTFTGTLDIANDVFVGGSATLELAGNGTLAGQTDGSIVLNGGTFRMDNTVVNLNRLRETTGTGLDNNGGGNFVLLGNASGTTEALGRLQMGATQPRSGALRVGLVQPGSATAATVLQFASLRRDNSEFTTSPGSTWLPEYSTVDFSATGGTLGTAASGPQVKFTVAPTTQTVGGLFTNTEAAASNASVGWATVNGDSFATYGVSLGVAAVATTAFPAGSSPTANALLTGDGAISGGAAFALNSLKIAPTAAGQSLTLAGGDLATTGVLLAGSTDFSIVNSGGGTGGLAGQQPRYVYVQNAGTTLTIGVTVNRGGQALVKAGHGTLALTGSNSGGAFATVINEGTLRADQGSSLSGGELRLRGGVLEITSGSFSRNLGIGNNSVNWSGFDPTANAGTGNGISEDRGSGGFAAIGQDATVDLNTAGASNLTWEDRFFVNSGYALTFGSENANRRVTFLDNINLTDASTTVNYNARQFRVIDNPTATTDYATISGIISGTVQNDVLKSGDGILELSGTNTFAGATIAHEGTLLVNGSTTTSFLTDVRPGAILGGKGTLAALKVENGGKVAPGDLPGHASILSAQNTTFAGGASVLSIEIGGPSAGGDGLTGYDRLNITGTVALNGASLQLLSLNGFLAANGQLFFILNNDGTDPVVGTFAQGSTVTAGSQIFAISYAADFGSNSFTGGNDIALMLIPEPSAASLVLAAALGIGSRRRRRPLT